MLSISYKSEISEIFGLYKETERFIEKMEKSINPDFINLRIQYRLLISKILIEKGQYGRGIQILSHCFNSIQSELQIRINRSKEITRKLVYIFNYVNLQKLLKTLLRFLNNRKDKKVTRALIMLIITLANLSICYFKLGNLEMVIHS